MRQGSDVLDALDVHARSRQRGDRALPTASWPANPHLKVLDAELGSLFGRLLGGTLAGKGRTLATALEATGATAGPAERIPAWIGDRDRCVIETRVDEGDPSRNAFLLGFGDLGHG